MLRVARARAPRARVNGARARRRARRSAARRTEATGNGGEHEPPPPPGGVVSFVLCAPEGPLNVGAAARVIQNFSLPSSLRVVRPSASVLRDDDDGASAPRLHEDAYKFAVHAKWMLDDCCARGESVLEAVAEASLVVATTARPRENLPLLTLGAACEKMRDEIARGGKCAILFGNERTGLTNEELELAEFGVSIPTSATVGTSAMARRNKYSGGAGVDGSQTATSLNLGMAVGVVAYELFSQVHAVREDDETKSIGGFNQPHRLTVGERAALIDDVVAARRAVDVFADVDAEEDVIFAEKERRAITAVLSSGPIATRDATPIFMLARRARALARLADPNALVADAARAYARANGGAVPSTKSLNAYIRETLGISLTKRELERAAALVRDDLPP
jgi:tRNA C32,U32 (ribose-2'-O)-methylase TrmJ